MKKFAYFLFISVVLFTGCKKDKSDNNPAGPSYQIQTGTAGNIGNSEATFTGGLTSVSGKNILSYGHVWSTSPHPTTALPSKTTFGPTSRDTAFTSTLTRLRQGAVIFVRAYATDSKGTYYGAETSFSTTEGFFSFVVSSQYLRDDSYYKQRAWVIIYNTLNQLVGVKEVHNGETCEFQPLLSKATDQYLVCILRLNDYVNPGNTDYFQMTAYTAVQPDIWYLGSEPANTYPQLGTNTVTLNGVDLATHDYCILQNQYTFGEYDPGAGTIAFQQHFNPDKIWIEYFDHGSAPYYKWIPNVTLNQNFTLTQSDFVQMTRSTDIQLPYHTDGFVYVESEDDLSTDYWEYFEIYDADADSLSSVRVYYPENIFTGYYTYISLSYSNISEYMLKYRGAIPNQFVSLNTEITVNNSDIHHFSAAVTGLADVANVFWYYHDESQNLSFYYNVIGSTTGITNFSVPPLPAEIIALNPTLLDLNLLHYTYTNFRDANYLNDYQDYLNMSFIQPGNMAPDYQYIYNKSIYSSVSDVPKIGVDRAIPKELHNRYHPLAN